MNIYNLQSQNYDLYYYLYFNTTKHVVAIHFRIGDYITLPHLYHILPLQYLLEGEVLEKEGDRGSMVCLIKGG